MDNDYKMTNIERVLRDHLDMWAHYPSVDRRHAPRGFKTFEEMAEFNLRAGDEVESPEVLPPKAEPIGVDWKYNEDKVLEDFYGYLESTYRQHYQTNAANMECFDAWIALGDSTPTFRNTALKYLWRYGKKGGNNKKDLFKALHYILLMLHVDHYNGD